MIRLHAFLTLLLLLLPAGGALAQVRLGTSVFYGSPYVFRGEVLSTGFVFQPTVTASNRGFSLAFFGNLDPKSPAVDDKAHFNEADLTLSYAATLGPATASAGYTLYTFPAPSGSRIAWSPTNEVFGALAAPGVAAQPRLLVAYDFDTYDGLYVEGGVGHDLPVGGHAVNVGAALGLDSGYLLDDRTALSHLALTARTDVAAGALTIGPMIGFQVSLADAYRAYLGDTFFYGGIGIGF